MVAQQILGLFVQVRVLVRQHNYLNVNYIEKHSNGVGLMNHWSDIFLGCAPKYDFREKCVYLFENDA